MSGALPLCLDPLKAADRGQSLQGNVPLSRLRRLADALLETDGQVECEFVFYRDAEGARRLCLKYRTELVVRCERCLGRLRLPLKGESLLRLADADREANDEGEDTLRIDPDGVFLTDVLEDELLLALPLIPRHGSIEDCEPDTSRWLGPREESPDETQTASPFDILRHLKN